jgi:uncharacterized membrane protein
MVSRHIFYFAPKSIEYRNMKNKMIEEQGRDWVEVIFEIIALTIISIIVFIGGIYLVVRVIGRFIPFWFSGLAGPLLVLGFDALWIIGTRKWHPKSNQQKVLKKIIFVTVFALSASILLLWSVGYFLRDVW